MELLFHGGLEFEILKLANGKFKWVVHNEDGEVCDWGQEDDESTARRQLALSVAGKVVEW